MPLRAVAVVSGVGHESDTTLTDLVSDIRAHTPTDAAQCLIPDRSALFDRLQRAGDWLLDITDRVFARREEHLERLGSSRVLRDARWILATRLVAPPRRALEGRKASLVRGLEAISPLRVLKRGYSVTRVAGGGRRLSASSPN